MRPPRIVTLTMNPTVDMACVAQSVRPMHKIRTGEDRIDPGGGGINVARVAQELGAEVLALVMTGGVTGRLVEELLDEAGLPWRALPVAGRTRIALNVHERTSNLEYRFVPAGPEISEAEWRQALAMLDSVLASGGTDWLVASGSLPRGVPEDFYARAAAIAAHRKVACAVDTSGAALRATVGCGVDLLKLSLGELEFLAGHRLRGVHQQEHEVAARIASGAARMLAISLGPNGALLGTAAGVTRLPALPVEERSAVGAGDCFLAALVMGLATGQPPQQALRWGVAAGAAAVASYGTGQVRRAEIEHCLRRMTEDGQPAAA